MLCGTSLKNPNLPYGVNQNAFLKKNILYVRVLMNFSYSGFSLNMWPFMKVNTLMNLIFMMMQEILLNIEHEIEQSQDDFKFLLFCSLSYSFDHFSRLL